MQTYQNLTDHELTIPNIGLVPPRGTIETDLELTSPNLQPITTSQPQPPYSPPPAPIVEPEVEPVVEPPVQAAPEQKHDKGEE